jgi:muramoyltetrapeptide carboxypeptidase
LAGQGCGIGLKGKSERGKSVRERFFFLEPGDAIGLFAPASPYSSAEVGQATASLEEMGFRAKMPVGLPKGKGKAPEKDRGYLAGTDDERRNNIHALMGDPEVKALLAVRGGYGSLRLLPALRPLWLLYPPKPIIGYSDVTALHMARLAISGVGGWHAPMLCDLSAPGHRKRLKEALLGSLGPWRIKKKGQLKKGVARGLLMGGNLSLLVSLLGTPYWPSAKGAILMVEDHGEKLYRLDRMLTALRLSGRLSELSGLVFGDFGTEIPEDSLRPLLMELAKAFSGPVAKVPFFGHGLENRPWPEGGVGELTVDGAGSSLKFIVP